MYLEPNNPSLSFANFLDAAIRDKAEIKPFPYTLEVCRCRYCSYCQNGKCALKRCCCMSERVKAKSCTFAELLRDCFVNFKDNVFQFRLRIACERASELKTCFVDIFALTNSPMNSLSLLMKGKSVCVPQLSFPTCRRTKCEIWWTLSTTRRFFRLTLKPYE